MEGEGSTQEQVRLAPLPDWVNHVSWSLQPPDGEDSCIGNGTCRLLLDVQADLSGEVQAWHVHAAQRILTREGAERAAHFVAEFDPAYQRLEVHFIRLLRGQERIEHAVPGAFQVFRRETSLERRVFNGRLTASLLIPDVRIDDVVEFAFTAYGSNPVLGGKFAAWAAFDSLSPAYETRLRVVRPLHRQILIKPFNDPPRPAVSVREGMEDSRWSLVGQKRRDAEDLAPPWLVLVPALQFSEFESWNEVANLFAPFYESTALPDALAAEVDRLAAVHQSTEERAIEWLRFVQQQLRYFAFSFGEGGLMPREFDAIWATRFGDCKDAARLYVAGARRLGVDACAALVSTTHGFALTEFVPSPDAFNHCIVRVRLDGTSYWLDPTTPVQSGVLRNIVQPLAGWALPLTRDTAALEKIGDDEPRHVLRWEDEVSFGPKPKSPAKLCRRIEYRFGAADAMRRRIANEGAAEFARVVLKDLQAVWPRIVETAPIDVGDDKKANGVSVTLNYEIPECWTWNSARKRYVFTIADTAVSGELQPLKSSQRQIPIYLGQPRRITRYLRMNMPSMWVGSGWHHVREAAGLKFVNSLRVEGRTMTNSKELVVPAWSLPASEAGAYGDIAKGLRENLLMIEASALFGRIIPSRLWRYITYWSFWIALMAVIQFLLLHR